MKIFFEDGVLREPRRIGFRPSLTIEAACGASYAKDMLEKSKGLYPDFEIYTNSPIALDFTWCWDEENDVPEFYVRPRPYYDFQRIDEIVNRKIERSENLAELFFKNTFKTQKKRKNKRIK